MQNIRFEKLQFRNVRRYSESELEFPDNQLVAIVGPNGSGKSTHLMAFTAALYGSTAEGINISDLVNRRVDKNLEIFLDFSIDSVPFQIARFYKHQTYKNQLILTRDGKDISRKTATETYELIESLLVPKAVFLNSIYFAQDVKDFFTCLTDKQQKEIFHSILQTHEYRVFYGQTDSAMSSVRDEKEESKVLSIQLETRKSELEKMLQVLKTDLQTRKEEQSTRIQETQNAIRQLQLDVEKLELELEEETFDSDEFDRIVNCIASTRSAINNIEKSISEFVDQQKKSANQIAETIESQSNEKISKAEIQLHIQKAEIDSKCSDHINALKDEITNLKQMLNEEQTAVNDQISQIKNRETVRVSEIKKDQIQFESNLDISGLKQRIASLEQKLSDKHTSTVTDLTSIKRQKEDLESRQKSLEDSISELKLTESGKPCPTCGQEIKDKDAEDRIIQTRNARETELHSIIQSISDLKVQFEQKKKDFVNFKEKISSEIECAKSELNEKTSRLQDNNDQCELEIKTTLAEATSKTQDLRLALQTRMEERTEQISSAQSRLSEINREVEKKKFALQDIYLRKREQIISESKKLVSDKIQSIREEIESKKLKSSEEEKELRRTLQELLDRKSTLEFQRDCIAQKRSTLKDLQTKIDTSTLALQELKRQIIDESNIVNVKSDIEKVEIELNEVNCKLQHLERRLLVLSFWKEAFSDRGIPSMLIDSSIPFLNEVVRNELDTIAPGKFIVTFDTISQTKAGDLREKFSVNVLNLETGTDKHNLLSGGEQRQIDVCCMRAIRLLMENLFQKTFNITLLDEVLDSLDDENSAEFCRHIKKLARGQNVTLITHSITQNAECDQVIRCSR